MHGTSFPRLKPSSQLAHKMQGFSYISITNPSLPFSREEVPHCCQRLVSFSQHLFLPSRALYTVARAKGAWEHQRAAEPRGRAASLRAPMGWDGERNQDKMEAGNFWRLKNLMARDESPFPLTGLDKRTLFAFFSHPLQERPCWLTLFGQGEAHTT